jgi:hypothetical protein
MSTSGLASYTDLSLSHASTYVVLSFSCPGLISGTTTPFAAGPSVPLSSCPGAAGSIARCGPKEASVMHLRITEQPLTGFGGEIMGVLAARLLYVDGVPIDAAGDACMYVCVCV